MPRRLFVNAANVHQGGGKTLLLALADAVPKCGNVFFCLDERMEFPPGLECTQIRMVKPCVWQRLLTEWWLKMQVTEEDTVICFGSLPPLFRLRGQATVFLQNRYLVDAVKLSGFPPKTRLRLMTERLVLSARMSNVDNFVVQTPSMQRLLQARTATPVHVLPFTSRHEAYSRIGLIDKARKDVTFDFVYVASGEPHKNHRNLIEAWCLLAQEEVFPSLKLTVDPLVFPELCAWMEQMAGQYAVKIENRGHLPYEAILELYSGAGALIYPSTFESFGLPLIEARQAGLPILSSELDYVRDIIDPEQTFDPGSAVSIAHAVKRHMGIEERPLPMQDAITFLQHIWNHPEQNANSHC